MVIAISLSCNCFALGTLYGTSSLVMLFMFLLLMSTNSYNEGLDSKVIGGVYEYKIERENLIEYIKDILILNS